jgi:hypothetical protein
MYGAHRGMVPAGAPSANNQRLNELLDQVRQEFDTQSGRAGEYEAQRTFASSYNPTFVPVAVNSSVAMIYSPESS